MTVRWRPTFVAAGLAFSVIFVQPMVVHAAAPNVRVEAAAMDDGSWRLRATVTNEEGGAQSQAVVTFLAATEFFGPRWVPVGSAVTDTSGTATLAYTPTWNGEQRLVARVSTEQGALESEPIFIEVSGAMPGVATEPQDLPIVRAWALPIGVAVVVIVWLVLAFIFLAAVIGISRRRPEVVRLERPSVPDGMQAVESRIDGGSST